MTVSLDGSILKVGTKCIVIANILFLDNDDTNVYVIMSGRKPGHFSDSNGIDIPYAQVTSPACTSANELKLAIVELIK